MRFRLKKLLSVLLCAVLGLYWGFSFAWYCSRWRSVQNGRSSMHWAASPWGFVHFSPST